MRTALLTLILFGCRSESKPILDDAFDTARIITDSDGDGFSSDEDCDDNNSTVNEFAIEVCDGVDNNCDGQIDEGVTTTYYLDSDGDGFGDDLNSIEACAVPEGYVPFASDCDDADATTYPSASEQCDGVDNDCDTLIDEELVSSWYADLDGDGYGDPESAVDDCSPGSGYVANDEDCDDEEPAAYNDAEEICDAIDNDCDGIVDNGFEATWYYDADNDGYGDAATTYVGCVPPTGFVDNDLDCDDINSSINPDGIETCGDYIDNDCDGLIDDADSADALLWYADTDSDGYGDPNQSQLACYQPNGHVADNTDCNDAESDAYPGNIEQCDGIDNDCDGSIDEDSSSNALTWYADTDSDGYGDPNQSQQACSQPTGYVADNTDCNDAEGGAYPGAPEYCNGIDDNCDGTTDESTALDAQAWYEDSDADAFGNINISLSSCIQPNGYVSDSSDCDPSNGAIYPGAPEYCNGVDDNCDGTTDENTAVDVQTWYADYDQDGFGNASSSVQSCSQPLGYVSSDTDCNDLNSDISPSASEVCNGIDDDCNGSIDDSAIDAIEWFPDGDGDGFGDSNAPLLSCNQPSGFIADGNDCDDGNIDINPNATELCDGIDNDCDGLTDDLDSSVNGVTYYQDLDGDGYGDSTVSIYGCSQPPSGYAELSGDCNDSNGDIHPDAPELWDCDDQNCDGYALPVGDGRDGQLTVGGNQLFSSVTHAVSGSLTAGNSTATLSSTSGLSTGDYVLMINMHGGAAGDYDILEIDSVVGSDVYFSSPLQHDYPASDTVVALRIPQYSGVNLGGALYPPAWNGSEGGIVAFMSSGTTNISGTVHANGLGYRGGARTYSATQVGQQGESYTGTQSRTTSANLTGGGGGSSPSVTHASGGGGGYATSGTTGNAIGGYGNTPGAGGGTHGDAALSALFFGGGGGSGGLDADPGGGSYGGGGAAGGGIVLMSAASLNVTGQFQSNGGTGENGYYTGSASPGGGGGGAGGSIFVGAASVNGTAFFYAQGGSGGIGSEAGGSPLPAGSGGNGRVRVLMPNAVNATPSAYSTCP